jgi:hypothetical protein
MNSPTALIYYVFLTQLSVACMISYNQGRCTPPVFLIKRLTFNPIDTSIFSYSACLSATISQLATLSSHFLNLQLRRATAGSN